MVNEQRLTVRNKQLGEVLLESGDITGEQLKEAIELQKTSKKSERIGSILVSLGYVTRKQMFNALEFQLGIPFVDLDRVVISPSMARYIPVSIARRYRLIPVRIENNVLQVAIEDVFDMVALDDVRRIAKMDVMAVLAYEESIIKAIDTLYGNVFAERAIEDFKRETAPLINIQAEDNEEVDNAPIVRLINSIMEQAVKEGASDIHFEPMENEVRVRMRVDGLLNTVITTPLNAHASIIARIKIMGDLNIAEKRLPQDGSCQMDILSRNIDTRISTIPTVHGEKAVMRILDRTAFLREKEELGFSEENLKKFDSIVKSPHGIILVTGPTGSGKSTTLYTMLRELNDESYNIITIEDPVEYTLSGISQIQVNPKAGITFSNGLRAILRQDPDTIMIGEIRDDETVEIAIRAAITGHRVLSTIHTNDAVSTISRLIDMGIPAYMITAALAGVIAQRLVKVTCPVCKQPYHPGEDELALAGLQDEKDIKFYKGTGCANCMGTGYKGRMAIFEVLEITRGIRELINKGESMDAIHDHAIESGMSTLRDETLKLLRKGRISLDEFINISYSQD